MHHNVTISRLYGYLQIFATASLRPLREAMLSKLLPELRDTIYRHLLDGSSAVFGDPNVVHIVDTLVYNDRRDEHPSSSVSCSDMGERDSLTWRDILHFQSPTCLGPVVLEEILRYWLATRTFSFSRRTSLIRVLVNDDNYSCILVPADHIRKVRFQAIIEGDATFCYPSLEGLIIDLGCLRQLKKSAHITMGLSFTSISGCGIPRLIPRQPEWSQVVNALSKMLQLFDDVSVLGHTVVIDLGKCRILSKHLQTSQEAWVKDMQTVSCAEEFMKTDTADTI